MNGWIKISRKMLDWGWYKDVNTKAVFLHLLLMANTEDKKFRHDTIRRGECVVSIGNMAETLGITYMQARTALNHLKDTKEITITRKSKYLVISIQNYNEYQKDNKHLTIKQQSNNNQITTPKESKKRERTKLLCNNNLNDNNILNNNNKDFSRSFSLKKPYSIPSLNDVIEYAGERASEAESFFNHYQSEGWKANGKKIYSWQKLFDNWQVPSTDKPKVDHPRYTDDEGYVYEWDDDKNSYEVVERPKRKAERKKT